MSLSEFYRLAGENIESAKQNEAAALTDLPIVPNNQLADLALKTDQNSFFGNTSNSKIERDEAFSNLPTNVQPVGICQDDDVAPWLSYPVQVSPQKDYSNLLAELPAVTLKDFTKINLSLKSSSETDATKTRALVYPSTRVPSSENDLPSLGTLVTNSSVMTKDTSTPGQRILGPLKANTEDKKAVKGKMVIEPIVSSTSVSFGTQSLKRKSCGREGLSEDLEDEFADAGKSGGRSKRGRAAEVHNLSERRRRDRINEKMRALQALIPNCNKLDKASMLDEAIEYMKTLQLQLQIMSMGAGLYVPPTMLTPQMQQMQVAHLPLFAPMGLGFGLGVDPMVHGAHLPGPITWPLAGPWSFAGPSQGLPLAPRMDTSNVDLNASATLSSFTNDLVQNDGSRLTGNAEAGSCKSKMSY